LGLETLRAPPRDVGALVVSCAREPLRATEFVPGTGRATDVLVAVRQVEGDSEARCQPLALREFGARIGELPRIGERLARVEERIGARQVLLGLCARFRRRQECDGDA